MDALSIEPDAEASPDGEGARFSLRPNRGRWSAMLSRSASALDVALRASLSSDRGTQPLTRWQRTRAAGAAVAGVAGIGGLATLAAVKPDLGPYEPAALGAAIGAAGLPAALCIRRAAMGAERRSAVAADPDAFPSRATRRGPLRRVMDGLRGPDAALRRRERLQARAVARTLADIAARERRLAERIAAEDGAPAGVFRASASRTRPPAPAMRPRPAEPAGGHEAPWAMPRDIAGALADLDARERLHAERAAAAHRAVSPCPAGAATGTGRAAAATPPSARRHARIRPRNTRTLIATEDGRKLNASIVDVSQSGVAIEGNLPGLWIGSMVTVGSRRAKAVRALPNGMAFEFSMPVPAEALTVDLVL